MKLFISVLVLFFVSMKSSANVFDRLEWNEFKSTPQYSQFVDAIGKMRNNKDQNDPGSWLYWANVHQNHCPHGVDYFLAWHRGYLYYFEKQLQIISGNDKLRVPYWDYYSNPEIPKEFTDNSSSPLFVNRRNTDVRTALSLSPFYDSVVNFERGRTVAFEPAVESRPHNPVHNIIGGWMPTLQSPRDPIFWLHHANIDRLWSAWVATANGRKVPDSSSPYWQGNFQYATGLEIEKERVIDSTQSLSYQYADLTLPSELPSLAPPKPPEISVSNIDKKFISPNVLSLGGASGISLNEKSITVSVPFQGGSEHAIFKSMVDASPSDMVEAKLLLRGVQITEGGLEGGYFYKVYINLPSKTSKSNPESHHFIGTLGAFEIAGLVHHHNASSEHTGWSKDQGVNVSFQMTDLNQKVLGTDTSAVDVSFIRVDAENTVKGEVIFIQSFEIVLESDN